MCRLTALKVFSKWGTGVSIVPQDRAPMHHTPDHQVPADARFK
jgi:hypothetical protein